MLNIWSPGRGTVLRESRIFTEWSIAMAKQVLDQVSESDILPRFHFLPSPWLSLNELFWFSLPSFTGYPT